MGYTAHELAAVSGVSVRTLHYYEEQGLLRPARRANGYRDYGPNDVRRLQQILLFRRADMPLAQIGRVLDAPASEQAAALREQLERLRGQHRQLGALIATVERMVAEVEDGEGAGEEGGAEEKDTASNTPTISEKGASMGERTARDKQQEQRDSERFAALKQQAIAENERTYGAEARRRYGSDVVDASNAKVAGMDQRAWDEAQTQARRIGGLIAQIAASPDPAGTVDDEPGRELCELHRGWLEHYWPDGLYTPEAHRGLAETYVADERFAAYYDAFAPGGAQLLHDAIVRWSKEME